MNRFSSAVTGSAELYSQLTGVLAGFVFSTMMIMLSAPPRDRDKHQLSLPLHTFLGVFFSLIVTSFLYAVIAGEVDEGRAALLNLYASFVFAQAAVAMFVSITWFFEVYDVSSSVRVHSRWMANGVALIAVAWMVILLKDTLGATLSESWKSDGLALVLATPLLLGPALGVILRRRIGQPPQAWLGRMTRLALTMTTAVAILFGISANRPLDGLPVFFTPVIAFILLTFFSIFLFVAQLGRPRES